MNVNIDIVFSIFSLKLLFGLTWFIICTAEYPISMCTVRTNFDVTTGGCKIDIISREVFANRRTFFYEIYSIIATSQTIVFTQFVVLHLVNAMKIKLIFQPARSDLEIGQAVDMEIDCKMLQNVLNLK